MRKVSVLAAVTAVVISAGLSGVVVANAASSTIYACISKTGTLSKVSTKSHSCPKYTVKLNWGTQGTAGLQGIQGLPGVNGDQGPIGPQGPAGADGSGLVAYTAFDSGQDNNLLAWVDVNTDYALARTSSTLPAGTYYASASSGFRNGNGAGECWINVDANGMWSPAVLGQVIGEHSISISTVLTVPEGGSTLSFMCFGDAGTTNYETRLTALKVSSVNPIG